MQLTSHAGGGVRHYPIMQRPFLGTGSAYPLESAQLWGDFLSHRSGLVVNDSVIENAASKGVRADIRTAREHLENIRSVLNPAIGDLAWLFDVSRQAVYKWLSEESTPDADKLLRIKELSQIADSFSAEKVTRAPSLLKMKVFGERSLLDILKARENSAEFVQVLIEEARAMEQSYARSGLSTTKAPATADWQSDVSIPGAAEER